jgi:hypothetical protein
MDGLNRFVSIKLPIQCIGESPRLGGFPRRNDVLSLWTKPIRSIKNDLLRQSNRETIDIRG